MKGGKSDPDAVAAYIESFPEDVRERLRLIRQTVCAAAPEATERLSWRMPALYQGGILLCYAAFKNHISIFPGPEAIVAFRRKLAKNRTSKGTIQFALDSPLPLDLIRAIVEYRLKENLKKKAGRATAGRAEDGRSKRRPQGRPGRDPRSSRSMRSP
jgi:uncharacterized protein YdhG (YjbR/CyaY superfamily)